MALKVLLEVKTQEGKSSELLNILTEIIPDTKKRDGFMDIEVLQDQDDPNVIILDERWETREDHEKYMQWRGERGDIDLLGELLSEPPNVRYFTLNDV